MERFRAPHPTTRIQTEYPPFQGLGGDNELDLLLRSTEIAAHSATYYHCNGQYAMPMRVIGDDMFYCVTRGTARVHVEGQKYFLTAGQCAHFARGMRHAAFARGAPFEVIAMHYDALVFGGLTLPHILNFPPIFDWRHKSTFMDALRKMCRVDALRPAGWKALLNALATQFLWEVVDGEILELPRQIALSWQALERILPALTLMHERLAKPLTMEQLAATCHLSAAHFRRVFRDAMGTSPLQYLQQKRLERACQLLTHGNELIESIAEQVGYEDPSYFSHTFRRVLGVPPGKYRKMNVV